MFCLDIITDSSTFRHPLIPTYSHNNEFIKEWEQSLGQMDNLTLITFGLQARKLLPTSLKNARFYETFGQLKLLRHKSKQDICSIHYIYTGSHSPCTKKLAFYPYLSPFLCWERGRGCAYEFISMEMQHNCNDIFPHPYFFCILCCMIVQQRAAKLHQPAFTN